MQLNQVPTQFVGSETTALEARIADQAVTVMPEEPVLPVLARVPQPLVWLGALIVAMWFLSGKR